MTTALLVLDMLDDFISGKLANPAAEQVIKPIGGLAEAARGRDDWLVVYGSDAHQAGDLELAVFGEHAMAGSPGACVAEALVPQPGDIVAGLHPATGGDGSLACSGDMLLQALGACAGVTLRAVATSLQIPVRGGTVRAEGDLDFRGTLGVSKEAPVGLTAIRLSFDLDADASADQLAALLKLTERYCVVYQTLAQPPRLEAVINPG